MHLSTLQSGDGIGAGDPDGDGDAVAAGSGADTGDVSAFEDSTSEAEGD
jgi:hypothetical protein